MDPTQMSTLLGLTAVVAVFVVPLVRPRRETPRVTILLYPVRNRSETRMRRELAALEGRRVLAVTDPDDVETIAALRRLRRELPGLDVLVTPGANDPSWSAAWRAWLRNPKAWREPRRLRHLPARQRRKVVYGYHYAEAGGAAIAGVHA